MKENSTLTKEQKIALKAEKKSEKAALRKEKREEKCKLLAKKKTKMTVFRQMQESFSPEEKAKINHHFEDFKLHCHMAKKETDFLHEDIEEALLYYKTPTVNKTEIKKAIADGVKFDGVRIESRQNIQIK